MGVGAIIGAVATVVGAGMQAKGASDAASASKNAAYAAKLAMERYAASAQTAVLDYEKEKLQKLTDIGSVLNTYGEGAFGVDTATQANLRKSQERFSELAAGDFGNFEALLRTSIKDSLAGSISSPIGAFTNISALNQFELMTRGASASSELTGMFDTMSRNLLGMEFGIMDQSFTNYWNIERDKVTAINSYITGAAQSAGTGLMAAGSAVSTAGQAIGKVVSAYNSNTSNAPRAIVVGDTSGREFSSTPSSSYTPYGGTGGASRSAISSSQPVMPSGNGGSSNVLFAPGYPYDLDSTWTPNSSYDPTNNSWRLPSAEGDAESLLIWNPPSQ